MQSTQSGKSRQQICLGFMSLLAVFLVSGCRPSAQVVEPFPAERIEMTVQHDGQVIYLVDDGNAYRELAQDRKWEFIDRVYDPEEVAQAYVLENGRTYRVSPDDGQRFETLRVMRETFEGLSFGRAGLADLVSPQRSRWGTFTLQSPLAPQVADYVQLRNALVEGRGEFRDARVEPTSEKVHSGTASLKCFSPSKASSMITCKASLSSPLPYFRRGDDFWYEAYYYIDGQLPLTIMDLESDFLKEHAGIRLRIYDDRSLGVELKALSKPQFRQSPERTVAFPVHRWVKVRVHFRLEATDGHMRLWQDDQLILDQRGATLPFPSTIYNSLEVGISAHSDPSRSCTLYLDDLRLSDSEFSD